MRPTSRATVDIKELERREKANPTPPERKQIENDKLKNPGKPPVPPGARGETYSVPPKRDSTPKPVQKKNPSAAGVEPQFPALDDNNSTLPPDVGGAVGPNHVMTTLNSQVRIQTRTGTVLSTVTLNNFFSGLGALAVFDPKVVYDPLAARWILTAPANSATATSALLLAVSATSDPTGTWALYSYDVDAANTNWFDYPAIGFNRNGIVVTGNLYSIAGNVFSNSQVYVFDKAAVYGGTAAPSVMNRPAADYTTIAPAITLDNSMNTDFLVTNWNGSSMGNGYLRIFTIRNRRINPAAKSEGSVGAPQSGA